MIKEEDAKVGEYRLGQLSETSPSKDGHVRCVTVRTVYRNNDNNIKISNVSRPIHKLCVIVPIEEQ